MVDYSRLEMVWTRMSIDGKVGDTPGAVRQINCVLLGLNSNL